MCILKYLTNIYQFIIKLILNNFFIYFDIFKIKNLIYLLFYLITLIYRFLKVKINKIYIFQDFFLNFFIF